MIKLLIFDLDGTLIDAYPAVVSSVNYTLKTLGGTVKTPYQIRRAVGWGDRELLAQFVGEDRADKALKLYRPHHAKALKKQVRFLPGALDLLKWASQHNYRLAVATNRPSLFSLDILKTLKVNRYFDEVLCADQAKKPKPAPDMLKEICARLKMKVSESLYVGDMAIDMECGKRARMKTIGLTTGSSTKKELIKAKAYKIMRDLHQLKKFLMTTKGIL